MNFEERTENKLPNDIRHERSVKSVTYCLYPGNNEIPFGNK